MKKPSSLLHGHITNTPLDSITTRLFFIFPLSKDAIHWLNTIIYRNDNLGLWINYWSGTHMLWGMLWGLARIFTRSSFFSTNALLITHLLFEIWELWAAGYVQNKFENLIPAEIIDLILDTIFAMIGYWIILFAFM